MIRCPNCGEINKDGSRFCNECGEQLQRTRIRCSLCGTMNQVGAVFCERCHARLVPVNDMVPPDSEAPSASEETPRSSGLHKISLPTKTQGVSDTGHLDNRRTPDWLQDLLDNNEDVDSPEDISEEVLEEYSFEEEEEDLAPSELPEWLMNPEPAEGEAPDLSAEPHAAESSAGEAEESVAPAELPDWLAEAVPTEEVESAVGEEPDIEERGAGDEMPDWLSTLDVEEPSAAEESPGRTAAHEPDEVEAGAAPTEADELPDWLAEAAPTAEVESAAGEEPDIEEHGAGDEMPDWLSTLDVEEPSAAEETPGTTAAHKLDEVEVETVPTEADELPDWLAEAAPTEEVESAAVEEPDTEERGAGDEMPDWLSTLDVEEPSAAEESPGTTAAHEPDEVEAGAAPTEADELPDWLADIEPDDEEPEESLAASAELEEVEVGPQRALKSDSDDLAAAAPSEVTEEPLEEGEAAPFAPESEEVPGEEEGYSAVEQEAVEQTEIPAWLQTLGPTPAVGKKEESVAVETPAVEQEEQGEDLEKADMPSWLRDLQPSGTGPLPSDRVKSLEEWAKTTEAETDLDRAEIPSWVQDLRPSGDAQETSTLSFIETPQPEAESEGLLSGLQSVLPAFPGIDVPEDYEIQYQGSLPSSVVKDAQLWQNILEQPHGEEHIVAQAREKPGLGRIITRVTVFVLLTLVILTSILGLVPPALTQLIPRPVTPAVKQLHSSVASLASEDSVILVLEYGPAEAAEMTHLTKALLSQLVEREVTVVAVSTIPTGQAMIQMSLDWAEAQLMEDESRELINSGYLPGGSPAVAQFLTKSKADLLLVLSARPARLRWWMEQNALLGDNKMPIGFGTSAALGPFAKPYFDLPAAAGGMVGLVDATAYGQLHGELAVEGVLRMNALVLTQWLIAGLLLVGAIYYLIADRKRERSA